MYKLNYLRVFLTHTDHHTLMARTADDRWEDGSWRVVTGEATLAHSGSIVNDQSGNIFVAHFELI